MLGALITFVFKYPYVALGVAVGLILLIGTCQNGGGFR